MNIAGQIAESNRFIFATVTAVPDGDACNSGNRPQQQVDEKR
jgi:hypothetical protein